MTERPRDRPVPRFDAYGVAATPEPDPEPAAPPPPASSHAPARPAESAEPAELSEAAEEAPGGFHAPGPESASWYGSGTSGEDGADGGPGGTGDGTWVGAGGPGGPGGAGGAGDGAWVGAGAAQATQYGPGGPGGAPVEPGGDGYGQWQSHPPAAATGYRPQTPYAPAPDAGQPAAYAPDSGYRPQTPYAPDNRHGSQPPYPPETGYPAQAYVPDTGNGRPQTPYAPGTGDQPAAYAPDNGNARPQTPYAPGTGDQPAAYAPDNGNGRPHTYAPDAGRSEQAYPPDAGGGHRPRDLLAPDAGNGYRPQTPYVPGADFDTGNGHRASAPFRPAEYDEQGHREAVYSPDAEPGDGASAEAYRRSSRSAAEGEPSGVAPPWSTTGQVAAPPRPDTDDQGTWRVTPEQLAEGQPAFTLFDADHGPHTTPAPASARTGQGTLSRPKSAASEHPWPGYADAYQPRLDRPSRRTRQVGEQKEATGERSVSVVAHLSGVVTAFLLPIALYMMVRHRSPFARLHASEAFNFQLTLMLGYVGAAILGVLFAGFAILLVVWAVSLVFAIQGAIAAETGREYRYPFIVRFID